MRRVHGIRTCARLYHLTNLWLRPWLAASFPMNFKALHRREFFAFFGRPIYGHIWLLWMALACLLIGWRVGKDPTAQQPIEDFTAMGKAAIVVQVLHLGWDLSDAERCRRLFEVNGPTRRVVPWLFLGAIALGAAWTVWAVW